jgi:hypothetical protein
MKQIKLLALAYILIFATACSIHRQVTPVSVLADNIPKAKIVIIRNYNFYGAGIHYWPTLDGQDIAGLLTNQYTTFDLAAGKHRLGVRCHGGWTRTFKHEEIEAIIESNKSYYYLLSPVYSLVRDVCAKIEPIESQEGMDLMKRAKLVPTGEITE